MDMWGNVQPQRSGKDVNTTTQPSSPIFRSPRVTRHRHSHNVCTCTSSFPTNRRLRSERHSGNGRERVQHGASSIGPDITTDRKRGRYPAERQGASTTNELRTSVSLWVMSCASGRLLFKISVRVETLGEENQEQPDNMFWR